MPKVVTISNRFRLGADRTTAPIDRFMDKISIDPQSGCWLWQGSKKPNGYAQFNDGKSVGVVHAHRWAYQTFVGPIPEGLDLDHLCRVRHCVNPAHLEPVTRSENLRRGNTGKTRPPLTHCKRGHPFDEANTIHKPNGYGGSRTCRACARLTQRERLARKLKGNAT